MSDSQTHSGVRVSVTIPVFNGMPFIQQAVSSVLEQLGPSDELVIVDNASTDGTREYLDTLDDQRVNLVKRSKTQPVGDNWTQAIQETRGRFVKLMCGDDLILLDCVERQLSTLLDNPEAVLVASQRMIVDEWDFVLIQRHGLHGLKTPISGLAALRQCLVSGTNLLGEPAAVLFRGDAIRAVMPWEDRWPYVLDLATYARLARSGDFCFVKEPLAKFRVSTTSWSSQILDQQPRDFRGWRQWQQKHSGMKWTWRTELRAEINLRLRSLGRRYFFRKVARKAQLVRSQS